MMHGVGGRLAFIPARMGSQGVPKKNIRPLGGMPLVAWTIISAINASKIDRVVVSTESEQISQIAKHWGAEVPFLRSMDLAGSTNTNVEVLLDFLENIGSEHVYNPDSVVLLQPTSPLKTSRDIDEACSIADQSMSGCCVSVTRTEIHPEWMRKIDNQGRVIPLDGYKLELPRRQTLPSTYVSNGAIYVMKTDVFLRTQELETVGTMAYVMPPDRSIEIDTEEDFLNCEALISGNKGMERQ